MAQTPFKARLGLETPTGQDVNSGGDIKINGVSINTGGTLDNVFYLDTQDMDDIADGTAYVKTENNLTDDLKTNYDSAYTHSTTTTGNPHSVTKTDVGLGNVVNVDTTNADNISDGTTNAIITLTQEANFETAYSKSHDQNTDTGTSSDDFSIGDGTDTDKTISIDNGDANAPQLKYNASTNTWQYSNDGTTFNDIGTLPSNLVYTDQENTFTETQIIPAIKPSVDSTTAIQITKADGITPVMNIDTTNAGKVTIGATYTAPTLDNEVATKKYVDDNSGGENTSIILSNNNSISSSSWVDDTDVSGYWYADISNANILSTDSVEVNFQLASIPNTATILSVTQSFAGYVRIYSTEAVSSNLTADLVIQRGA